MVMINELNERSREIFRKIVEAYVDTGEPVGSRTVARRLGSTLSPATIRNVMADLEDAGLLYAPHTSAGRLPTETGLKLFVDGLLEVGHITPEERKTIDESCAAKGRSFEETMAEATTLLSGLSSCAGLVVAPKTEAAIKHIEFVPLSPGRALVILVAENGAVENRVIEVPSGMTPANLVEAANYLNARLGGRRLDEVRALVERELEEHSAQIDALTERVVSAGLAERAGSEASGLLIVRGRSKLLDDVTAISDLERLRHLFDMLERRKDLMRLLDITQGAEGVKIFIGAESELFGVSGCSMILAPLSGDGTSCVGAIGVIGPTHINYARIIPVVDYTAKVVSRLLG